MQDKFCMHCIVSGLVQGVGYRASTQKQALLLEITGWVRNLPNGNVEVLACGEKEKVLALYAWLKQGPALAKVEQVTREDLPWQEYAQFAIT
jgi:acylphosphatase